MVSDFTSLAFFVFIFLLLKSVLTQFLAFIVVISLASTITLSFFLAKEWSLFGRLQSQSSLAPPFSV